MHARFISAQTLKRARNSSTALQSCATRRSSTNNAITRRGAKKAAAYQRQTAPHSTTATMDFQHSASAILNSSAAVHVPKPTWESLKTLFVASAIPMVGFGFMDNFVMIQAGQYIDSTLGVSLGLATMTAAAAGQVVSDVSGVIFGGSLERLLIRLSLIKSPALTGAQRQLPICRNVAMAGAVLGVIVGCGLGAVTLLMVDLEARDRISRAVQLREIVTDMIRDDQSSGDDNDATAFACDTCTVYVVGEGNFSLDASLSSQNTARTRLALLHNAKNPEVQECARDQQVLREETGRFLYAPVVQDNQVMAVLEFRHKQHNDDDASSPLTDGFGVEDVTTAKVMARHLGIVLKHVME